MITALKGLAPFLDQLGRACHPSVTVVVLYRSYAHVVMLCHVTAACGGPLCLVVNSGWRSRLAGADYDKGQPAIREVHNLGMKGANYEEAWFVRPGSTFPPKRDRIIHLYHHTTT